MTAATAARWSWPQRVGRRIEPADVALAVPRVVLVALWLVWAEHDGGYDNDTWYWGALVLVGLLSATLVIRRGQVRLTRWQTIALGLFAVNLGWSFLSMAWAQSPGIALQGSNRELLYLLIFGLISVLPWTPTSATLTIGAWSAGIGLLAVWVLVRLGTGSHLNSLFNGGRLEALTGYSNATAALFMMGALTSVALATRRALPGPVRGALLGLGCADLQLTLVIQSRGWLFTLPIVLLLSVAVVRDRLRVTAFAVPGAIACGVILHRLLAVYAASGADLGPAAGRAGRAGLFACFTVFVVGTLLAWADGLLAGRELPARQRRWLGGAVCAVVLAAAVSGGLAASHGHPIRLIVREWHGFSHQPTGPATGSRFLQPGSGRLDIWRVALDAFAAHPIGGLGQDNFGDYYIARGRSGEEPSWTHSLELRLLAHTGVVGLITFAGFLWFGLRAALRVRRRGSPDASMVAGLAVVPLIVWLIHGSIDWFWELPALAAPAIGLLAIGAGLEAGLAQPGSGRPRRRRLIWVAGGLAGLAATLVLCLPYLATRELSDASDVYARSPAAALSDLRVAARLDPLDPDVPRLAGTVALLSGRDRAAVAQFSAELGRRPGDWFGYLGRGLARSALGHPLGARADFARAARLDRFQPANELALRRALSSSPLTAGDVRGLLQSLG